MTIKIIGKELGFMILAQTKGDKTKEKIISVAKELFRNNGYDQVLIKDISAAVGIAAGNLNYYFPTKESIAMELVDRYLDRIRIFVDETSASDDHYYAKMLNLWLIYFVNIFGDKQALRFYRELVQKKKDHHSIILHGVDTVYRSIIEAFGLDIGKFDYKYFTYADLGARQEIIINYLNGRFPELDVLGLYRIIQVNTMRLLGIDPDLFESMIGDVIAKSRMQDFSHIHLLD
ncbi:MAG: TetR/AcrR family transcriptional regulator [Anaerofustis sp.]